MLWIKAFHLIFVITWFAGLFYLPRLFVYHAMTTDPISLERFKIMERKLFYGIMTPSAILATALGSWLLVDYAWTLYATFWWLHLKMTLACLLIAYHIYCGYLYHRFKNNQNQHSALFYRWLNEVPVIILIIMTILVIVKP
jgi:protoporphyrinogen IX oxidase